MYCGSAIITDSCICVALCVAAEARYNRKGQINGYYSKKIKDTMGLTNPQMVMKHE